MKKSGEVVRFPVERTRQSEDPELTPLEILEALAADIRSGKYKPHAVLVGFVDHHRGQTRCPYVTVGFNPLELGGLLARLAKELS